MKSQTAEDGWRQFLKLCRQLKIAKQYNDFFDLFLTAEERRKISNQHNTIKALLKNEEPQRDIAVRLGISIAKISRGSNYLKIINKDLRKFLESQLI